MRIRTVRRIRFWTPILVLGGMCVGAFWTLGRPILGKAFYADEYAALAQQCDNAMHDHAAIRSYSPDRDVKEALLLSAEVQLLVCHEYDKLRKRMLLLGVSEDQLALYGLERMENEAIPVRKMVEPHEMPRF